MPSLIEFDVVALVWLTATDCRANLLHLFIFKPLIYKHIYTYKHVAKPERCVKFFLHDK